MSGTVGDKQRNQRLTFGQVEAVLAEVNHIANDKRAAFMSRLKFLQKNGVPMRRDVPRGKGAHYTFEHLMQIALALEFQQAGLTPQRATDLVKANWYFKKDEILALLAEYTGDDTVFACSTKVAADVVWVVRLEELAEFTDGAFRESASPYIIETYFDDSVFASVDHRATNRRQRRALIIDVSVFLSAVRSSAQKFISTPSMVESLRNEEGIEESAERFHQAIREKDGELKGVVHVFNDQTAREKFLQITSRKKEVEASIYLLRTLSAASIWASSLAILRYLYDRDPFRLSGEVSAFRESILDLVDLRCIAPGASETYHLTSLGKSLVEKYNEIWEGRYVDPEA